jgi:hypothetical protein
MLKWSMGKQYIPNDNTQTAHVKIRNRNERGQIMNHLSIQFITKAILILAGNIVFFGCTNSVNGPSGPANHRLEGSTFVASDAKFQLQLPAGSWQSGIDTTINSSTYALWASTTMPDLRIVSVLIEANSGSTDVSQRISIVDSELTSNGDSIISSDTIRVNGKQFGEIATIPTNSGTIVRINVLLTFNNGKEISIDYAVLNSLYPNYVGEYDSLKSSIIFN